MVFAPEPLPWGQSWPHLEMWLLYDTCPTVLPESQGSPTRPRGQGFGQPPAGPASRLLQERPPHHPELGLCSHITGQGAHSP